MYGYQRGTGLIQSTGPLQRQLTQSTPVALQQFGHIRLHYRLANQIGSGAFSDVYRATTEAGKKVAIKVYNSKHIGSARTTSLLSETHMLNEIVCCGDDMPVNVARTLAVARGSVVMEFVGGVSLSELRRAAGDRVGGATKGSVNIRVAARAARHLMRALSWMHSRGLAHRDVKLENVMWDEGNDAFKLIDFNLVSTRNSVSVIAPDGAKTSYHKIWCENAKSCDTPLYFSPELVDKTTALSDGGAEEPWRRMIASDVWAAALTVCWFATGRRVSAFPGRPDVYKAKTLKDLVVSLIGLADQAPCTAPHVEEMSTALDAALHPDWRQRAGAEETAEALLKAAIIRKAARAGAKAAARASGSVAASGAACPELCLVKLEE